MHKTHKVVLVGVQFDLPLVEFASVHDFVNERANFLHAFGRIRDLVLLEVFHLAGVTCEVFREGGVPAALGWEVEPRVAEIHEEQWLVLVLNLVVVFLFDVFYHIKLLFLTLAFNCELVRLRGLSPIESVHLIGLGVVSSNDGLARHVSVRRVIDGSDLVLASTSGDLFSDEVENRRLLNKASSSIDVEEDPIRT